MNSSESPASVKILRISRASLVIRAGSESAGVPGCVGKTGASGALDGRLAADSVSTGPPSCPMVIGVKE